MAVKGRQFVIRLGGKMQSTTPNPRDRPNVPSAY